MVILTSDHGEMLGKHRQLLNGPQLYDDLRRVPLLMRWPTEIHDQKQVSELVQWIDLPATILQATGCSASLGGQGRSLLPLVYGQVGDWAMSEFRYSGFPTDPPLMTTMVRHGNWKLITWHGEQACSNTRDGELYDLAADPKELHNLFHDHAYVEKRHDMKGRMLCAMLEAEDKTAPLERAWSHPAFMRSPLT